MKFPAIFWDLFAYLMVVVAGMILWSPPFGGRGHEIYVSPDGSDWNSGASIESAVHSIQCAADSARAGDRIIILPGTYHERVHVQRGGVQRSPVEFVAREPGTVTISGRLPEGTPADWAWTDEGDGIYSTATAWPVYALSSGDEALFRVPWGGVAWLRELVTRPKAWGAFCYQDRRLFVFLKGNRHPTDARLFAHLPVPEPREWGEFKSANVWVEADHIVFSGIKFEMGIGAGLLLWNAENVAVKDCLFYGATLGVKCGTGRKSSNQVVIERCFYHNYPQYHWHRDWLSWDECYSAYASSSLIASRDDGMRIANNLVLHAGDALRVNTAAGSIRGEVDISGNWLALATDDALELDGHARNVRFHDNLIFECHEGVSASPLLSGPVVVANNLFLHPSGGINGAQLKMLFGGTAANRRPEAIARDLVVEHNAVFGNWLCWASEGMYENVLIHDNVFCNSHRSDPPWPKDVRDYGNVLAVAVPTSSVSEMIKQLEAAATGNGQSRLKDVVDRNQKLLRTRPGPVWLDWDSMPAILSFLKMLENKLL